MVLLPMKLVISVDVEEEGLFSGYYRREPAGVSNVAHLARLEFVTTEFGCPVTLLATYPVLRDAQCRDTLLRWRDNLGAEIGTHLHPWSTPPYDLAHPTSDIGHRTSDVARGPSVPEPIPARSLPAALLEAKLRTLAGAAEEATGRVLSAFRMGRFDHAPALPALLVDVGVRVDSSVVPLSSRNDRGDMFLAPNDPHVLLQRDGTATLVEVPLTMVAVSRSLATAAFHASALLPDRVRWRWLERFHHVGAVGINPTWYRLPAMRWAGRLHERRGGRVLHMFLHSSELMPGATPVFRTERDVDRLVARVRAFLGWVTGRGGVEGVTLSQAGTQIP
jgi:hypothetical protein